MKNVNRELWMRPMPISQCQYFFFRSFGKHAHPQRTRITVRRSYLNEPCTCRCTFCVRTNFRTNFPVSRGITAAINSYEDNAQSQTSEKEKNVERKNKYDANTETIFHRNKFIRSAIQRTQEKIRWFMVGNDGKKCGFIGQRWHKSNTANPRIAKK